MTRGSRIKNVQEFKNALLKNKNVVFAYLYGSFLTRKDWRDIDIAVYLKKSANHLKESSKIAAELEETLQYAVSIDVHVLNPTAASFAFQVISEGKILMDKDPARRAAWEAHVLSRYQDFKPVLDFYDRHFLSSASA